MEILDSGSDANKIEICGVRIPLRDGIHLQGALYKPKAPCAPSPCIVALTPYLADNLHLWATYFSTRGLAFLAIDVRGRGESEGVFRPNVQEARDGYDVVEWVARQAYCNGQVAMWGSSYLGHCQWAAAKELPPHLATIVPTAAPYVGLDFPRRNNIFRLYAARWLTSVDGRTGRQKLFSDGRYWGGRYQDWYASGRPFRDADAVLASRFPIFQEWLDHPDMDEYWDACNPSDEEYSRIELPTLTITGCYDGDQPGALEHYRRHVANASPAAAARHFLVIGPWNHHGTVIPKAEFAGVKCSPESVVDLPKLHREWYAWTMLDGPRPEFLRERVAFYVMGADRWRYARSLEAVTRRHEGYFLDSRGSASDVYASGLLGADPGAGPPDQYRYDPRDRGHLDNPGGPADEIPFDDQRAANAMGGRLAVYHSAPFPEDVEVSGFFKLSAWISIDCPDTDFFVSIYEMAFDGTSLLLSTDSLRARYREGLRAGKLVDTDAPIRYDFNRFTFISREIKRGHRLRLVISPIDPEYATERNCNAGGVVAEESIEVARVVTVKVFHDESRPSVLLVPYGQPAGADGQ